MGINVSTCNNNLSNRLDCFIGNFLLSMTLTYVLTEYKLTKTIIIPFSTQLITIVNMKQFLCKIKLTMTKISRLS